MLETINNESLMARSVTIQRRTYSPFVCLTLGNCTDRGVRRQTGGQHREEAQSGSGRSAGSPFYRMGRSVLGSMNDIRFQIEVNAEHDGGLANIDLVDLHHRLTAFPSAPSVTGIRSRGFESTWRGHSPVSCPRIINVHSYRKDRPRVRRLDGALAGVSGLT